MKVLAVSSGGAYVELPQPIPETYITTPNEESVSGRNTSRTLYKDRITIKQTIEAEWIVTSAEEKNLIVSLTGDNSFNVRYLDITDDQVKYGKFYRGNDFKVTPMGRFDNETGTFAAYDIFMSMVEF